MKSFFVKGIILATYMTLLTHAYSQERIENDARRPNNKEIRDSELVRREEVDEGITYTFFTKNNKLVEEWQDDGFALEKTYYDTLGNVIKTWEKDLINGIVEMRPYKNGYSMFIDSDANQIYELRTYFDALSRPTRIEECYNNTGNVQTKKLFSEEGVATIYYNLNNNGIFEYKQEYYYNGQIHSIYLDTDEDYFFEQIDYNNKDGKLMKHRIYDGRTRNLIEEASFDLKEELQDIITYNPRTGKVSKIIRCYDIDGEKRTDITPEEHTQRIEITTPLDPYKQSYLTNLRTK